MVSEIDYVAWEPNKDALCKTPQGVLGGEQEPSQKSSLTSKKLLKILRNKAINIDGVRHEKTKLENHWINEARKEREREGRKTEGKHFFTGWQRPRWIETTKSIQNEETPTPAPLDPAYKELKIRDLMNSIIVFTKHGLDETKLCNQFMQKEFTHRLVHRRREI